MWWIWVLLAGCALVTTKHAFYRANAFSWQIAFLCISLVALGEVCFWNALRSAPSFFQPWFLGNVALALFGLVASLILGDKGINTQHYVGMVMALGAGYLLAT